jgi:hypothetical protein
MPGKLRRARIIRCGVRIMLAAIEFDHQLASGTGEVRDPATNGVLTAEFPQ